MQSLKNKILIADDDDSVLNLVEELEASGYYVRRVVDGLSALEAVDSFIPDMAILNLDLAEINGYEACEAMLQNSDFQHTVFIAFTDQNSHEQQQLAHTTGFHYYFRKPVKINTLQRLLSATLPEKAPSDLLFSPHCYF